MKTKYTLVLCTILLITAFSGCTDADAPSDNNDASVDATTYGSTINLYADKDSVSLNNDGKNFFEGGFDLNQLKDVETIKLQSGGHEFIYKLVEKTETDTGSIDSLWFENTNPAPGEDLFDSTIGFRDVNGDGIIDRLLIPADFDGNKELDTQREFTPSGGPKGNHAKWSYVENNI